MFLENIPIIAKLGTLFSSQSHMRAPCDYEEKELTVFIEVNRMISEGCPNYQE